MENITENITRVCTTCKIEKELSLFGKRNGKVKYKYNRDSMCKSCKATYEKNRVMSNPEKKAKLYAANKEWTRRNKEKYAGKFFPSKYKKYGEDFKEEDYNKLLEEQGGICAICKEVELRGERKIRLSIDHNHETGAIRGLLCGNCNRAIGLLKDCPDVIFKAWVYLSSKN